MSGPLYVHSYLYNLIRIQEGHLATAQAIERRLQAVVLVPKPDRKPDRIIPEPHRRRAELRRRDEHLAGLHAIATHFAPDRRVLPQAALALSEPVADTTDAAHIHRVDIACAIGLKIAHHC